MLRCPSSFAFAIAISIAYLLVVCCKKTHAIDCGGGGGGGGGGGSHLVETLFDACLAFAPCRLTFRPEARPAARVESQNLFAVSLLRHIHRLPPPPPPPQSGDSYGRYGETVVALFCAGTPFVSVANHSAVAVLQKQRTVLLYVSWLEASDRTCPLGTRLVPRGPILFNASASVASLAAPLYDCLCLPEHTCAFERGRRVELIIVLVVLFALSIEPLRRQLSKPLATAEKTSIASSLPTLCRKTH
jgi:hypothetical protein